MEDGFCFSQFHCNSKNFYSSDVQMHSTCASAMVPIMAEVDQKKKKKQDSVILVKHQEWLFTRWESFFLYLLLLLSVHYLLPGLASIRMLYAVLHKFGLEPIISPAATQSCQLAKRGFQKASEIGERRHYTGEVLYRMCAISGTLQWAGRH